MEARVLHFRAMVFSPPQALLQETSSRSGQIPLLAACTRLEAEPNHARSRQDGLQRFNTRRSYRQRGNVQSIDGTPVRN